MLSNSTLIQKLIKTIKNDTWVVGLCGAVQQTDVNTTKMDDVVQSCYHHSPYCDNQSHHGVDQEQQVRQEEQTLSGTIKYFR